MGNWMADALLDQARPEAGACILSYGLSDTSYLPPGALRRKDLYTLIRKDDELVLLELKGSVVNELCDSIAAIGGIPLAGIRLVLRDEHAASIEFSGHVIHPKLIYRIAVNRRWLYDPHLPKTLFKSRPTHIIAHSIRKVLLQTLEDYKMKGITIESKPDKRIYYEY